MGTDGLACEVRRPTTYSAHCFNTAEDLQSPNLDAQGRLTIDVVPAEAERIHPAHLIGRKLGGFYPFAVCHND